MTRTPVSTTQPQKRNPSGSAGWSVLIVAPEPDTQAFKNLSPLVRRFAGEVRKESTPPVVTESEWLLKQGVRLSLKKVQRDLKERTLTLTLSPEEGDK